MLRFLNDRGETSVVFDMRQTVSGVVQLQGSYCPNPVIRLCLDSLVAGTWEKPTGTKAHFSDRIANHGWTIGDHTYGLPSFVEAGIAKVSIGKYVSFASGVHIALGDHRTDLVSTYPFTTLARYWPGAPSRAPDHTTKGDVVIGSDVWVGLNVYIGSGVTIGHGAVIGAQTVVVKDVAPYAVVVGNPARVVRYRFNASTIRALLETAWWTLPDEVIDRLLPDMMQTDIWAFIESVRRTRAEA